MRTTNMRWPLGIAVFICAALALFYFFSSTQEVVEKERDARTMNEVTVVLNGDGFSPRSLRISKGTRVIFSNESSNQFWPASNPHPTHTIYGAFDAKQPLNPGEEWAFVFDTPGVWRYHDHMRSYFTGVVYVE